MSIIASIGTRSSRALCVLAAFLCSHPVSASAQNDLLSSEASTVSVAALAVPAKARQHLERARRALLKRNEAEYQRELAAALTTYPRFAEAYILRASHELLLDRYAVAIDAALTAQRMEPSIHWATVIHAMACNQLGLFDQAAALLDGMNATEMNTWQAMYERTRAAVGTGDTEAALRWSERALAAVPPPQIDDTVLLRGDALLMAHRWADAVTQFQAYLHSSGPQPKRAQVLALLDRIPQLAQRDAAQLIASTSSSAAAPDSNPGEKSISVYPK